MRHTVAEIIAELLKYPSDATIWTYEGSLIVQPIGSTKQIDIDCDEPCEESCEGCSQGQVS